MRIGKLKIHYSFFLFLAMAAALDRIGDFFCAFLAVSLHEMSHMAAAGAYRLKIDGALLTPIGETAYISGIEGVSASKKYAILFAGPAANLLLAALFWRAPHFNAFAAINLSIGIFNLLPVYPLDGGKILFTFSGNRQGVLKAVAKIRFAAKAGIILFFAAGFFQLVLFPFNISLLLIAVFFRGIFKKESEAMIFSYYKCMLGKRANTYGAAVKTAVFAMDTKISEIERIFTWDFFHIIYALDEGEISACFTEAQIFEASSSLNRQSTLRDVKTVYSDKNPTAESAAVSPSPTAFDI